MTQHLAILGASGHGKVVADAAEAAGWEAITFFDDAWPGLKANGPWPVEGDSTALAGRAVAFAGVAVAIGDNRTRLEKARELKGKGASLPAIVHPRACVSPRARLGQAAVVFAGAVVNIDAAIGFASIINTGATVDHDCLLGEGVHVSPGAHLAGGVTLGEGVWVGIGASVKQGVRIGAGAIVGAGAVVIADVEAGATVAGVPAQAIGPVRC